MTRHFFDRDIRLDPENVRAFERYQPIIEDWDAFLEALRRPLPTTIWTNTLRTTPEELQEHLHVEGIKLSPVHWYPGAFYWNNSDEKTGGKIAYQAGLYHVQEEVSMLSGFLLDAKPHQRALDMCAAPGNKTAQVALQMKNTGTLVANDRSLHRVKALRRVLERLGVYNTTILNEDAGNIPKRSGPFDRIMVDVPCSCEGTSRKNPGIFHHISSLIYEQLGGLQRAILRKAILLCKPGGRIVFSTCTYAPEENECVVDHVLQQYPEGTLRVVPVEIPGFVTAPGLSSWQGQDFDPRLKNAARVYPHLNDTGGFFVCILEKALESEEDKKEDSPTVQAQTVPLEKISHIEDPSPYYALLEQRFAIPPSTFQEHQLLHTSNKVIAITSRDNTPPTRPKPEIIGVPFMRKNSTMPKITTSAILTFGALATRNIIDLNLEEAHQYVRRAPITLSATHLHNVNSHGYVILRYRGIILGLGVFRGDASGGTLESQFPKSWMIQDGLLDE